MCSPPVALCTASVLLAAVLVVERILRRLRLRLSGGGTQQAANDASVLTPTAVVPKEPSAAVATTTRAPRSPWALARAAACVFERARQCPPAVARAAAAVRWSDTGSSCDTPAVKASLAAAAKTDGRQCALPPAALPTPEQLAAAIQARRSVFPHQFTGEAVHTPALEAMLAAARCAPSHGRLRPWRFVVMGREEIGALQDATVAATRRLLAGDPTRLQAELASLESDRAHRWSTCSHFIAICLRRSGGHTPPGTPHRYPIWEEVAACACAVQNMHLIACANGVGCYWSSWHDGPRDGPEVAALLGIDRSKGDACLGFLVCGVPKPGVLLAGSRRALHAPREDEVEWRD